jgi:hypothetical protein
MLKFRMLFPFDRLFKSNTTISINTDAKKSIARNKMSLGYSGSPTRHHFLPMTLYVLGAFLLVFDQRDRSRGGSEIGKVHHISSLLLLMLSVIGRGVLKRMTLSGRLMFLPMMIRRGNRTMRTTTDDRFDGHLQLRASVRHAFTLSE